MGVYLSTSRILSTKIQDVPESSMLRRIPRHALGVVETR